MTDAAAVLLILRSLSSQYLTRNGIRDVTRDHFSFSAKIKLGDFYEARDGPQVISSVALVSCSCQTGPVQTELMWFNLLCGK